MSRLAASFAGLGPRRLAVLGLAAAATFLAIAGLGLFLSRPALSPLYSGLDAEDVSAVAAALAEAGIGFDIGTDGKSVAVAAGKVTFARRLLAEKGLPQSSTAGYELFDKLGSLGLTSFMQDVTRVRALEGELARTIQTLHAVKAARVHLVLGDEGSFRRARQQPSASVVIRTHGAPDPARAAAIRHLVAAAVPGLAVGQVTVLGADGTILASGDDQAAAAPARLIELERDVAERVMADISRTLAPHLGLAGFQVSVAARLDIDQQQVSETTYDPDSRIERSVRSVKETQASENAAAHAPASVEEDIPQSGAAAAGEQSSARTDKREELTNYELNTKTVQRVSQGYRIHQLAVAVALDRAGLAARLGDGTGEEAVKAHVEELRGLIASVAGLDPGRGDQLSVIAVPFIEPGDTLEPVPGTPLADLLASHLGTLVNAAALLAGLGLVVFAGIRPALRSLARPPAAPVLDAAAGPAALTDASRPEAADAGLAELERRLSAMPERRLEKLIAYDEAQAAVILKQWLREGRAA